MGVFSNNGSYTMTADWLGVNSNALTTTYHHSSPQYVAPTPPKPKPTHVDWLKSEVDAVCGLAR